MRLTWASSRSSACAVCRPGRCWPARPTARWSPPPGSSGRTGAPTRRVRGSRLTTGPVSSPSRSGLSQVPLDVHALVGVHPEHPALRFHVAVGTIDVAGLVVLLGRLRVVLPPLGRLPPALQPVTKVHATPPGGSQ